MISKENSEWLCFHGGHVQKNFKEDTQWFDTGCQMMCVSETKDWSHQVECSNGESSGKSNGFMRLIWIFTYCVCSRSRSRSRLLLRIRYVKPDPFSTTYSLCVVVKKTCDSTKFIIAHQYCIVHSYYIATSSYHIA